MMLGRILCHGSYPQLRWRDLLIYGMSLGKDGEQHVCAADSAPNAQSRYILSIAVAQLGALRIRCYSTLCMAINR